jgi:hypothetical protein
MTSGRKKLLVKALDLLAVCGLAFSLVLIVLGMRSIIFVTAHHWRDWPEQLMDFDGGLGQVLLAFLFGLVCLVIREVVTRIGPPHDDEMS